jgi:putative flippase GtrA
MSMTSLALRYTIFAILATIANLAAQRLVLMAGDGDVIFALAVLSGTAVGLVLKFVLDKHWIFLDRSKGIGVQSRQFGLYTLMGVATTAIFWGFETAAWIAWGSELLRELGAICGLAIGYVTKYYLDKRFVFGDAQMRVQP